MSNNTILFYSDYDNYDDTPYKSHYYMENRVITFNSNIGIFPSLNFWENLPTKSIITWKDLETGNLLIEYFSHVANNVIYVSDYECDIPHSIFEYDEKNQIDDFEIYYFPVKIEVANNNLAVYVWVDFDDSCWTDIDKDISDNKIIGYETLEDGYWYSVKDENVRLLCENYEGAYILKEEYEKYKNKF